MKEESDMMKKIIVQAAFSLALMSGVAFANTAALHEQQHQLHELEYQLEHAQRTAVNNARMDQRSREAIDQQAELTEERRLQQGIADLEHQIEVEHERVARQEAELARIDELRAAIAEQSETLHAERMAYFYESIATHRQAIQDLRQARIDALQAEIDETQAALDELQATIDAMNEVEVEDDMMSDEE